MNKYHNKKVMVNGISFDSQKEANRYCELKLMERAGEICDLQLQVSYELIPKQTGERACSYVADFVYTDVRTGRQMVEDVKGYQKGPAYSLFTVKRKLMLWRYGIKVIEV